MKGVSRGDLEAGRGAAPADSCTRHEHPGGSGAPPGTTRSPCREPADAFKAAFEPTLSRKRGPGPIDAANERLRSKVRRRCALRSSSAKRGSAPTRALAWRAERRRASHKDACTIVTDCVFRRAAPFYAKGGNSKPRMRKAHRGKDDACPDEGDVDCRARATHSRRLRARRMLLQ